MIFLLFTYLILLAPTLTLGRNNIPPLGSFLCNGLSLTPCQSHFLQLSLHRPAPSCFWPASFTFASWSQSKHNFAYPFLVHSEYMTQPSYSAHFDFQRLCSCNLFCCICSRQRSCQTNRWPNCCERHPHCSYLFSCSPVLEAIHDHIFHIAVVRPYFSFDAVVFGSPDRTESSI